MRLVVISDSHGSYRRVADLVERNRDQAEAFIHLGDGLQEVALLQRDYPELPLFFVRGNCDWGDFIPGAQKTGIHTFDGVKILYTHGDEYGVKYSMDQLLSAAKENGARVALYGHTHIAASEYVDGIHLINPGSISQPRDGRPSYMVLDIVDGGIVPVLRRLK